MVFPLRTRFGLTAHAGIRIFNVNGFFASVSTRTFVRPLRHASPLEVIVTGVPSPNFAVKRNAPSQLSTSPSPVVITAHSLNMPGMRGPFTEQQFNSGVPARD